MKVDWTMIVIVVCLFLGWFSFVVLLPMFNTYLEYKRDLKMHEQDMKMYEIQKNEKGLQRDNDVPDIKQGSGKSDEGTSLHDEELSL